MKKKLKAYKIECADDDHGGCVVFAENPAKARHKDTRSDTCDCEFIDIRIRRAPTFDDLSPGPVTTKDYLARGWFHWCSGCGDQCWESDNPVIIDDHAFCSRECIEKVREQWRGISSKHRETAEYLRKIEEWISAQEAMV